MAEATVRSQASPELTISEDEDSSMNLFLQPHVTASGIMAESKQKVSQKKDASSKTKSSSKTNTSAKLEDLAVLEDKLSAQIDAKFSSLDEIWVNFLVFCQWKCRTILKFVIMVPLSWGRWFSWMMTLRVCVDH